MEDREPHLRQGMGLPDVIALGVSAAVGTSIFSVVAPATQIAGPAMLIALGIAAVPMAVFVVVYAFMGSAVPRSGASYDWPARFVHPFVGFIVVWLRIIGSIGALSVMAVVFVAYLSQVVAVPERPTMFLLLFVFYVVNVLGVNIVGGVARVLVLLKIVVFATFIVLGLPHVQASNFSPMLPYGPLSVLAALPLLVGLYTGIESAAEAGEEIKDSRAAIGKGLAIATVIGMTVYFGTSIVTIGVLATPAVAASKAPLLEAGRLFLGSWSNPVLLFTALISIAAAVNAFFMIFARFLFAMGRDGSLPGALARIHPRWRTPHVATTVAFLCGVAGLLLPANLVFLFLAANIPTMLKYLCNCIAASRLVERHPDLHARATFQLSRRAVKAWSYAGVACAILIILSGLQADWRPYGILVVWGAVGTIYWFARARHGSLSMRKREAVVTT